MTERVSQIPVAERVLPAMLALFVGSGCAALIYEVVWFQMLQLLSLIHISEPTRPY